MGGRRTYAIFRDYFEYRARRAFTTLPRRLGAQRGADRSAGPRRDRSCRSVPAGAGQHGDYRRLHA